MKLLQRRAVLGLLAGASALAFPAVAAANVNPHLVLTPGGPAGATGQTLNYDLSFTASNPATDTPTSITTHFPAGLLADLTIDGGKCLTQTAQDPNCIVASGNATTRSGLQTAKEYLVQAPKPTDVAGVLLAFGGDQVVADVPVRPSDGGLDVAFSGLQTTPQLIDLNLSLTDLRLPSSCSAEQMTVQTTSKDGANETSDAAPYQSTGCPSQAYNPQVTAHVNALVNSGAEVIANITQNADEAASKSIQLNLPSSLQPNLLADAGCLQGVPCQVGTASALTPLAPAAALANGTLMLGGTVVAPTMTVTFPAPYALTFVGAVNTGNNSLLVQNSPDVPITSLSLDIKNTPYGQTFLTNCEPSSVGAAFTGQGGQSKSTSVPISYTGCAPMAWPPSASSSLTGLGSGNPVLKLQVTRGSNAPKVAKVAITLGKGLSFSSAGLIKECTGHGQHRKCKIVGKGLSISGAKLATIKLRGGKLVLTFKHAVSLVTIEVRGPLLAESKNLRKKIRWHKIKKLPVTVKITDLAGTRTTIALYPRA